LKMSFGGAVAEVGEHAAADAFGVVGELVEGGVGDAVEAGVEFLEAEAEGAGKFR